MDTRNIRKLDLDLPRQPVVDTRPWSLAGWLLFLAIIAMALYSYVSQKDPPATRQLHESGGSTK